MHCDWVGRQIKFGRIVRDADRYVFFAYLKIFTYQDSIKSHKISSTCRHLYVVKMKYRSVIFSLFLKGTVYKIADCLLSFPHCQTPTFCGDPEAVNHCVVRWKPLSFKRYIFRPIRAIKTGNGDQGTQNYRNFCGCDTNWIRWSSGGGAWGPPGCDI